MANRKKSQWLLLSMIAERNSDIKILDKYIDNKTKINVECKICGMRYQETLNNILIGKLHKKGFDGKYNGCGWIKHCNHDVNRQNDILKKLNYIDKLNSDLEFIEPFNPKTLLIKCKCKICNTIQDIDIDNLFSSDCVCPKCGKNIQKSINTRNVKKRTKVLDNILNRNKTIILLSKTKSLLEFKCTVCSKTFEISGYMNRKKINCPFCENKRRSENRKNRRFEEKNSEYTAIKRKCEMSDYCIVTGNYKCVKNKKGVISSNPKECKYLTEPYYKKSEYKSIVENSNHSIEIIGEYIDSISKIKYRCKNCGKEFFAKPIDLYYGKCGCKECHQSKGEMEIRSYLNEHHIDYEIEKAFDDCKNVRPLRFDFYIPSKNIAIEYDGKQHYEPSDYFGGKDKFNTQIKNDEIKNDYCKKRKINLIRIPYYCDSIYDFLNEKIRK